MAESAPTTFRCRCCGEDHPGPPLSWAMEAPDEWFALTPSERRAKGHLSSDQCVIDPKRYFVRGSLELPVLDGAEPPYFGWLCNSLPGYPETLSLKTNLHTRAVGIHPFIELEPTDHPLAVEQREGITMARVIEIAEIALHHNAALTPRGPTA